MNSGIDRCDRQLHAPSEAHERPKVDAIDIEIMRLLMRNARQSNRSIAVAARVSESNSYGRIRRLVDTGVIRGFHADVDFDYLGYTLRAVILVKVRASKRALVLDEARQIAQLDGVLEVLLVAGTYDLMVQVVARDSRALRDLVITLGARKSVAATETNAVMEAIRGKPVSARFETSKKEKRLARAVVQSAS